MGMVWGSRYMDFKITVGGYTDTKTNQRDVVEFLKNKIDKGNVQKIEIIEEHSLGRDKYIYLCCAGSDLQIPDYK